MAFDPYLFFGGNCREAMTRYQEILGGDLEIMTGADAPPGAVPDDKADLVMHGALITDGAVLMASDTYDDGFTAGRSCYVHYTAADVNRASTVFDALCEGGTIESPGEAVFWSPFFGACIDRFGTAWQVSVISPDHAEG